jgi:hypothetical protein
MKDQGIRETRTRPPINQGGESLNLDGFRGSSETHYSGPQNCKEFQGTRMRLSRLSKSSNIQHIKFSHAPRLGRYKSRLMIPNLCRRFVAYPCELTVAASKHDGLIGSICMIDRQIEVVVRSILFKIKLCIWIALLESGISQSAIQSIYPESQNENVELAHLDVKHETRDTILEIGPLKFRRGLNKYDKYSRSLPNVNTGKK